MTRTLQVKLFGMTESKKKDYKKAESALGGQIDISGGYESSAGASTAAISSRTAGGPDSDDMNDRIKYLEEQN